MKIIPHKSDKMLEIERKAHVGIEEVLRVLYVDEARTIADMCNILSISYVTCIKWLHMANITSRRIKFNEGSDEHDKIRHS